MENMFLRCLYLCFIQHTFILSEELEGWLNSCGLTKSSDVRGVIAPHAGYSYSGRAAAYAFGNIDPSNIKRVFLLGPSHHYYTPKCALSTATVYKTPIGDLPIDLEVNEQLKATGKFETMDIRVDEAEHSMEMHLPYLARVFEGLLLMIWKCLKVQVLEVLKSTSV
ncbi:hypothetical protein P8452_26746 [Trifolium repens]|nr:hypothetical protein P8452_26746 [Trifolium repens]